MKSIDLLGVRIDKVTLSEAVKLLTSNLKQHVVSTPNIEFLIYAQKDEEFRQILNKSDLNIPDSSRFGWLKHQLEETNSFKRFFSWWLFPFSNHLSGAKFPTTTGIDLIEALAASSAIAPLSFGLIGGQPGVAEKAASQLKQRYPRLKVVFAISGGQVSPSGKMSDSSLSSVLPLINKKCDVLLVAFGHGKQERWIQRYKNQAKSRVFIGCGGSFDYLAGNIPRAPFILRFAGLEWLFRLILQPWRIRRQLGIFAFILKLI